MRRFLLAAIGIALVVWLVVEWPWYYAEARRVRRLAEALPGVTVLEVDGNHDVTLEDLWLEIEYRGTKIGFSCVTAGSFDGSAAWLCVHRVGDWQFREVGYTARKGGRAISWAGAPDFSREGFIGREFDPPIDSIPEFLERLDEVKRAVADLPLVGPGRWFDLEEPTRYGAVGYAIWRTPARY